MKTTHKPHRFGLTIRSLSLVLAFVFFMEQIVYAAPDAFKPIELSWFKKPPIHLNLPESVAIIDDF